MVRRLKASQLENLSAILSEARDLFEHRNRFVHSVILAGGRVRSLIPDVPDSKTSPEELDELAARAWEWKERLSVERQRVLKPFLASRRE
jgi:hypothetical protein